MKTIFNIIDPKKYFKNTLYIINKFCIKNKIKLKYLNINLDFNVPEFGYYYYKRKSNSCTIFINPDKILKLEISGFFKHPDDYSMDAVLIHEFSHFIDDFLKIERQYIKQIFDKERPFINIWAYKDKVEEVAETISMFILNPFLLRLIDEERYHWFNERITSPTPCTKTNFFRIYSKWSPEAKLILKNKFNLIINEKTRTIKTKKVKKSRKNGR